MEMTGAHWAMDESMKNEDFKRQSFRHLLKSLSPLKSTKG